MVGFAILLGFNVLGVVLKSLLSLPLPSNVIGLILFVIALSLKWIRLEWVEAASQLLLRHMMLFFAPYIVGIISVYSIVQSAWIMICAGLLVSTGLTLIMTGMVTQFMLKRETGTNE